ncbi:MAG TPA: helicase HerA-like domain-containing protein [Fimbriimonadales bacterium]|nr:helicase HerA-like domain-containing protein [Fimbriimonadales bacterium]
MAENDGIYIGLGEAPIYFLPKMANRHGLIAGATGTGKTVSLQVIAEALSEIGVPVFMADVKGDLAGISQPGATNAKIEERVAKLKMDPLQFRGSPCLFWDPFGQEGQPVRATVTDIGPLVLSRMLDLNDVQEGVLNIAFKLADEQHLLLLDLKDLRAMLQYIADNAQELTVEYGLVSDASVGAIQRQLLVFEQQGGAAILGEPALDIKDLMQCDPNGKGYVSILAADKLMQNPRLYGMFLLWLLSELFEELPEVGDLEKPKIVFFFDEAHLLFDDIPKSLLEKIEQVVRLIRSKGVGVFFITQNPIDIPDVILGQLGNKIQHALRAFTPKDQQAIQKASQNFRVNPNIDVAKTLTEMGVGEALVSLLDEKGTPAIVQRTLIRPPLSRIGAVTMQERGGVIYASPFRDKYTQVVDRESAYELLGERTNRATAEAELEKQRAEQAKLDAARQKEDAKNAERAEKAAQREAEAAKRRRDSLITSGMRTVLTTVVGGVFRGVLGSLKRRL